MKQNDDNSTIGILLCREKNYREAEIALRDINKPIGVGEFQITSNLPDNLKSSLPTIEEFENELKNLYLKSSFLARRLYLLFAI